MKGLNILLVDDEPVFRMYLKQMNVWSSKEFVIVGEAENGDEALKYLEKQEIDIVIMDVSMPGKNGVVLSDLMARQYPDIAIIAVSSYDDYDYVRELLKNGAYDYILKSRISEELLQFVLKNIQKRIQGRSSWETRQELRRQAGEWLWGDSIYPFTSDNSRMAATIISVRKPENEILLKEQVILEGIGKIAESVSKGNMDVLACVREPTHVVLLSRFYDTVSESEIRRQLDCNRVMLLDSVLCIYNLKIEAFQCPLFFNDLSLRSFLLHKLEEAGEPVKEEIGLTLSLGRQKQLLAVVEEMNPEKAERLVREIYEDILPDQDGRCLMVTKELLELIQRISNEYHIELDFLPREFMLFQYAKVKRRETLVSNIAGLYHNVLREIREVLRADSRYSEVVNRAIEYQRDYFHQPISLKETADHVGVSPSYLSRIFHEETELTVTDYLRNVRMEKAKQLLEEGVPLKHIVSRCGFCNYGYFLRIFKEYTGKTPKEYLKR